jgi:hypothetical protein
VERVHLTDNTAKTTGSKKSNKADAEVESDIEGDEFK